MDFEIPIKPCSQAESTHALGLDHISDGSPEQHGFTLFTHAPARWESIDFFIASRQAFRLFRACETQHANREQHMRGRTLAQLAGMPSTSSSAAEDRGWELMLADFGRREAL